MFCPKCGANLKPEASFCPACGHQMPATPQQVVATASQVPSGAPKKHNGLVIALSIGIGVLVLAVILVVVFLFFGDKIFPKESTKVEVKTEQSDSNNNTTTNNDYKIADSNSRYLSESELQAMSTYDLYIARNEIFARHGRDFTKSDLKQYFSSKSWYHVQYTPSDFDAHTNTLLNDFERKNADLMLKIERSRNSPYLAP